jgi:hypothetical protein
MTDPVPSKELRADELTEFDAALVTIAKRQFTEANRCFSDAVCECVHCEAGRTLIAEIERLKREITRVTGEREPPHCSTCSCGLPEPDIRSLWNKAVILQDGNRATVTFETAEEAETAFDYMHDLGSIERPTSEPKSEHGGRIMTLAECVEAEGGIPFVGMEASTEPLTHQEIFSAVHHHASEIMRLTAAVPAQCSSQPPGAGKA